APALPPMRSSATRPAACSAIMACWAAAAPSASITCSASDRRRRLLLGHSRLAQPDKVGGLRQGADLRFREPIRFLDARQAAVSLVELLRLCELGVGALVFAFEGISRGKPGMHKRQTGVLAARLFQRADRLVEM